MYPYDVINEFTTGDEIFEAKLYDAKTDKVSQRVRVVMLRLHKV